MNFPAKTQLVGDAGGAGAVGRGGHKNAAPAQFVDDTVMLMTRGSWNQICDGMARSIIRLQNELDEANARIALLEEERNILGTASLSNALRGTTVTKAAVTEGGEQQDLPAGVSRIGCPERPEPSPHLQNAQGGCPHCGSEQSPYHRTDKSFNYWCGSWNISGKVVRADMCLWRECKAKLERERDEARAQYQTTHLLAEALAKTQVEMKAELQEARK